MAVYYLDKDYRLHAEQGEDMQAWEDRQGFFRGKSKTFIEGFRVIPDGEVWIDADGTDYHGPMIAATVAYETLDKAQTEQDGMRDVMTQASAMLTDAQASTVIALYPGLMEDGSLITAGTRINWNGQLKRAAVDLWDTEQNNPDNAPTLWEDVNYRDGYRIIPEVITAGLAFAKGEIGWWGDVLYRSLIDDNVYTPDQYAAGWEVYEA